MASLLGNNAPKSDSPSRAATPGGGFKLDPKMLATLQTVLASGGNVTGDGTQMNLPDYFAGTNSGSTSSNKAPATPARPSTASSSSAFDSFNHSNSGNHSSIDALRNSSNQNALIQTPSTLSAFLSNAGGDSFGSCSTPRPDTPNSLALSLSKASQNLQGINTDNLSVQDKINALVESLKLDPNAISSILNGTSSTDANASGFSTPFRGMTPQPSNLNGYNQNGDNDVDVDSLLKEFLDTSGNNSNQEGNTPRANVEGDLNNSSNSDLNNNNWDSTNSNSNINENSGIGDFSFSPVSSAAFLQNMTDGDDFGSLQMSDGINGAGTAVGSWGVTEKSSSNPPSDGTNTGGTSTPVNADSPSAANSGQPPLKKRKAAANLIGALGNDINSLNAETRAAAANAGLNATVNNTSKDGNQTSAPPPYKKSRG